MMSVCAVVLGENGGWWRIGKCAEFVMSKKSKNVVINIRKYNKLCISGKKKDLLILYVPTYIFRRNKPLNNNRNSNIWDGT